MTTDSALNQENRPGTPADLVKLTGSARGHHEGKKNRHDVNTINASIICVLSIRKTLIFEGEIPDS